MTQRPAAGHVFNSFATPFAKRPKVKGRQSFWPKYIKIVHLVFCESFNGRHSDRFLLKRGDRSLALLDILKIFHSQLVTKWRHRYLRKGMAFCCSSWAGGKGEGTATRRLGQWSVVTKTLFHIRNRIKKKHCVSMSTQYWRVVWTVGFAETNRLWYTNVDACNIYTCLNWHWLTMLGIKINLSGALRTKLFFFVWRRCLEWYIVSRNVWKEYCDISPLRFSIKVNVVKQESVKQAS